MGDFDRFLWVTLSSRRTRCQSFYFLYIVAWGRIKIARQKLSKNLCKWIEIPQFTQGKQNTFILSYLLCILETICQKKTILMVNPVKSDNWKSSANDVALSCLNWMPVNYLRNKTFSLCLRFITWWKPRRTFGRIQEQFSKNPRHSQEVAYVEMKTFLLSGSREEMR